MTASRLPNMAIRWMLLAAAALAAVQRAQAQSVQVAVQYEDGKAKQVVEAATRLGYTVYSSVPDARVLFLNLPAAQQAAASQALAQAAGGAAAQAASSSAADRAPSGLGWVLAGDTPSGDPVWVQARPSKQRIWRKASGAASAATAAALSAAAAAPFVAVAQQDLAGLPGVASVQRVGMRHLMADVAAASNNDAAAPLPLQSRDATAAASTAATKSPPPSPPPRPPPPSPPPRPPRPSPSPPPPPPPSCPAWARTSGHGDERVPWGIDRVQAMDKLVLNVSKTLADTVLICTIDTGLDPSLVAEWPAKISGCLPTDKAQKSYCPKWAWNESSGQSHASHVLGTVAARWNGLGVVGVAPFDTALHHINVFGDIGLTSDAETMQAMVGCMAAHERRKAANRNARLVMSMSLAGLDDTFSGLYNYLATSWAARGDVLVFAAAGNYGNDTLNYPAAAEDIISVAATAVDDTRAYFSQANDDVELAAPGATVLSMVPRTGAPAFSRIALTSSNSSGGGVPASLDNTQALPADGAAAANATGRLVDCGLGQAPCPGAKGAVCLIQRGGTTFCSKVANCTAGGGVGAIIYNKPLGDSGCDPLALSVTVEDSDPCFDAASKVPVMGISLNNGLALAAAVARGPVTASILWAQPAPQIPTDAWDGTSMATPHAAAVAAVVWSAFPTCPASRVRRALQASAKDLGAPGRDPEFGYGLVQARAALDYLKANPC